MSKNLRCSLLVLALLGFGAFWNTAESSAAGRDCCQACQQPCGRCRCCPTPACARGGCQHACCQQKVCQERDVVTTEYRNEQVYETVPVTVTENVTVDEGSYQTVWVPRLVTKAVPRTVYETRSANRTVPYQVTRRVTDCSGDAVSSQAYRTDGTYGLAVTPSTTATASRYPTLASPRKYPTPVAGTATASSTTGRVPDARYAEAPVTPIAPRTAAKPTRAGSSAAEDGRIADRSSLFVPAPSAAQVWRSTAIR